MGGGHAITCIFQVGYFRTFVDRVERIEVKELDAGVSTACIMKSNNNGSIDGILVLGAGCVRREEDNIVRREAA